MPTCNKQLEAANEILVFMTGQDALTFLKKNQDDKTLLPEIIFLDINMPKLSGMKFYKSLNNPPYVIFTTAYREYAVESFDLDVLDYLVKPISFERFLKAINKFLSKEHSAQPTENDEIIDKDYIILKSDKKNYKLKYSDILFIESSISRGSGKVIVTGNLGDVMKESATIALAYLKSNAEELGIDPKLFTSYDINIHVPQGAIPKDGPSAGVTLLTALTSLFTQKRVAAKLAMTGEITLRGKVLPVGGIKEKILAAKRAMITTIILCDKNRKDIEEIEAHYLNGMTFHYVGEMQEVLDLAILDQKVKNAKKLVPVEVKKS